MLPAGRSVCSPPLCYAVPALLRPVLPTLNEDSCSTGHNI